MARLNTLSPTTVIESGFDDLDSAPLTMDTEDVSGLISLLGALYTDPEYAVLRELTANAIDSHRMSGRAEVPVKVTLPTTFDPYVTVSDTGLGMDRDELVDTFCKVRKSTKRSDDRAIGAFGIGSKAPFSVSGTFTVDAVKNGHRMVIEISKDSNQTPTRTTLVNGPTDQPNGVKITVPVSTSAHRWSEAANRLFSTWLAGPVEVNGTLHDTDIDDPASGFTKIADEVYHHENHGGLHVVMGGIVYPVSGIPAPDGVFLSVAPGTVSLVPSRDAVMVDHRSRRAIEVRLNRGRKIVEDAFAEAEAEADPNERLVQMSQVGATKAASVFFTQREKSDLIAKAVNAVFLDEDESDKHTAQVEWKTLRRERVASSREGIERVITNVLCHGTDALFVHGDDTTNLRAVTTAASRILRYGERPENRIAIFPKAEFNGLRIDRLGGMTVLDAATAIEEGTALYRANRATYGAQKGAYQYDVRVCDPAATDEDGDLSTRMPAAQLRDEIADGSLVTYGEQFHQYEANRLSTMLDQRVVLVCMGRAQVSTLHERAKQEVRPIRQALSDALREQFLALTESEIEDALVIRTVRSWIEDSRRLFTAWGFTQNEKRQQKVFHRVVAERGIVVHGADTLMGRSFAQYIEWLDDPSRVESALNDKDVTEWPLTYGKAGDRTNKAAPMWSLLTETVDQSALDAVLDAMVTDWTPSAVRAEQG